MTTKRSYKKKDLDKYVEENEIELIFFTNDLIELTNA